MTEQTSPVLPTLPTLPTLLDAPMGRKLRVEGLNGPRDICSRLCAMGIVPGTELEVKNCPRGKGCVYVRVRQGSLVLDESAAGAVCFREDGGPCPHDCRAAHCGPRPRHDADADTRTA